MKHILIKIFYSNFIAKAILVCKQKTGFFSVGRFDKVVVKLEHEQLSEVKNTKLSINGAIENNVAFSEMDGHLH